MKTIPTALAAIALATALSGAASADVYVFRDGKGNVVLTDQAQYGTQKPVFAYKAQPTATDTSTGTVVRHVVRTLPAGKETKKIVFYKKHSAMIRAAAAKYELDPTLVSALVAVESNYNENAISKAGAVGLMQLMPQTAYQLGVKNPYDPEQNVEAGTKYLRYLIERFEGNVTHAIAAYNAGPINVEEYGGVPPFSETRRYVNKIYSLYKGARKLNLGAEEMYIKRVEHEDGTIVYTNRKENTGVASF